MSDPNDLSARDPGEIRQQIDETRSSITDKLESLEEQVRETVQSARETIQDTVSTVKNSVEGTVETVKETFDIKLQVQRHPLPMVGGALILGFALGRILESGRAPARVYSGFAPSLPPPLERSRPAPVISASRESFAPQKRFSDTDLEPRKPGMLDQFSNELQEVKGVAIGYAVGAVRDLLKQSFPSLKSNFDDMATSVTTKLGGKPVREPVLDRFNGR